MNDKIVIDIAFISIFLSVGLLQLLQHKYTINQLFSLCSILKGMHSNGREECMSCMWTYIFFIRLKATIINLEKYVSTII